MNEDLLDSAPDLDESTEGARDANVDVSFQVTFTHRLRQTHDVAGRDFRVLESVLSIDQPTPPKVLFFVDSNLVGDPNLGKENAALVSNQDIRPIRSSTDTSTTPSPSHQLAGEQRLSGEQRLFGDRLWERLQRSSAVNLCGTMQVIPGGEVAKHHEQTLRQMLDQIHEHGLDRRSVIVVAGGGAVLDAAGFAAAIAHRGIRLVRLPSTTLAQADSGVGVKNAINYYRKKNWIGTFAVPWAVINDTKILETLPDRDFRCGLTEAVKVALLKDQRFFEMLSRDAAAMARRRQPACAEAIARSCRLHLDHITLGGDPFEALQARPLDFGHWSAHRLEPMTGFRLRHGEAVGIGVALDTLYSVRKFGLTESAADTVFQTLSDLGAPLWCDDVANADVLLTGLEEFRQHLGGELTVTMLRDVGEPFEVHEIDHDVMRQCIDQLQKVAVRRNATVRLG